ncbi:MAG: 2-isopropylmalate synthase [Elusimicrobia bacterium]|nr:2-isopropylmalate synthase [Elusimicrobiota bacterium]
MRDKVTIFDTTLRDGEQSPGCSMDAKEKLEVAHQLARLKVDVLEAGFPISSPGDFKAVQTIAETVGRGKKSDHVPQICGLARAIPADIDACWNAVKGAKFPRIHTFLATSDVHMKFKLKMTRGQVLERAVEMVKYARKYTENVEFSPEDAVRSDFNFLAQVVTAVIDAGASTVNVPDTVGYSAPVEFGLLIKNLFEKVPNIRKTVLSVHCHNDLGLAVSNSLAAVLNGARQVECTINGLGERAGNASLEEIVMILKTRPDLFHVETGVETKEIYRSSRLVSQITGVTVQPNKAIVGTNAFSHSSGIHQDGMLKHRMTYEIMDPKDVGIEESVLLLTARSGRNGLNNRLKHLGFDLTAKDLDLLFEKFKILADKKKYVFDDDLAALLSEGQSDLPETYVLEYLNTSSGTGTIPTATVRLKKGGQVFQEAACGDGPVDATYKAIDKIAGCTAKLEDYSLRSISSGKDALGEVTVRLDDAGAKMIGRGTSTDIIEASAKAYLSAVNRLLASRKGAERGKKINEKI